MVDMIGVTVRLPLNIRKGPGTNYGIMGTASPSGKVVAMDGVEDGENYKGVNKWYYKVNDKQEKQWYWAGRLNTNPTSTLVNLVSAPVVNIKSDFRDYVTYFNKPWLSTEGNNVTIVVIDTGISVIAGNFKQGAITEIEYVDPKINNKDHGTFIAGILAGSGGEVRGISSGSNILSLRFDNSKTKLKDLFLNCNKALQEVLTRKQSDPDARLIVNLSQGFNSFYVSQFPDQVKIMTDLITQLDALHVPVFCAAGDNILLLEENKLFPAYMLETIAVGCISQEFTALSFTKDVNFITPLQSYWSYSTSNVLTQRAGSSFSVAIMTALAAAFYSNNNNFSKLQFLAELQTMRSRLSDLDFKTPKYQFS